MRPLLIDAGPFSIPSYGAALAIAFVVGAWIAGRHAAKIGIDAKKLHSISAWVFVGALIGSRALCIAVERPDLASRPETWLQIWNGGLVFYGGFIGALVAGGLRALMLGLSFWTAADLCALPTSLGHAIVRLGCFLNGCCYGREVEWGVVFPNLGDGVPRHPTQLYEAAAGVAIFLGLLWLERRPARARGDILFAYCAAYGAARFAIEAIRDDPRGGRFAGLTISQWIAVAGVIFGMIGFAAARLKRGPRPSP